MFEDKYEIETWAGPSMATIRARHLAAMGGKCRCGKLKDPTIKETPMGKKISCLRCLGTIKRLA